MDILIFIFQCAFVFVAGTFLFDIVHYILHAWETSSVGILRFLGGLHAVHHDFLDRNMQIQKQYTWKNIFWHVIPEYLTGIAGTSLFVFVVGWQPVAAVVALRTLMVAVYVYQQGQDFTHNPLSRISSRRSLIFVGPNYHALHHVFPRQHYSSFVNIFDLLYGTNCQIAGRRFLIVTSGGRRLEAFESKLKALGAEVVTDPWTQSLPTSDVLVVARESLPDSGSDSVSTAALIGAFRAVGKDRLLPPEVWNLKSEISPSERTRYLQDRDIIFRHVAVSNKTPPHAISVGVVLFFIRRGFCRVPLA